MTDSMPDNSNRSGPGDRTMTTSEMLEMVAVDALGLLDDDDRSAFDRAYAAAPSAVRELVWAEQARIAELGLELPDVSASPESRRRFLDRVRQEIERSQVAESAPASRKIAHAAGAAGAAAVPAPRSLGLRPARRVSSMWRVATVGASVAAVVLAVLQVQLRQNFDELRQRSEIAGVIEGLGLDHVDDALFADASVQRVQFTPVGSVGRARAMLLRNPDRDTSRLYVRNLQSRTSFTVVAVDENNRPVEQIASFETDDLLTGVDLDLPGAPGETLRVAIMSTGEDPAVLFVAEFQLA